MKNLIKKLHNILYLVLMVIIKFQLKHGMFAHQNCFEHGQWLKYNWKAKVMIYSAIKNKLEPKQFDKYLYKYPDKNVKFTNGDSCSAFWVRKLYFWERKTQLVLINNDLDVAKGIEFKIGVIKACVETLRTEKYQSEKNGITKNIFNLLAELEQLILLRSNNNSEKLK